MQALTLMSAYAVPLVAIWAGYLGLSRRREIFARARLAEAQETGMTEPASLHPLIDPDVCVGCGACVSACPEGRILGLINSKAELVEPSSCIGHGACATACPMAAIDLVFGTEKRGIDIPHVGVDFQTNAPGIYIAGELGGMGLIRNAVEQGRQAVEAIAGQRRHPADGVLDLVIVGAGPAGISASLAAKQAGLSFATLEQDTLGGTVAHFPRGKLVMTAPVTLPLFGQMKFRETSKEKLLAFWQAVISDSRLEINVEERVTSVKPTPGGIVVATDKSKYKAHAVLLAIGRRGTPRKLEVEGEDSSKVVYRLVDPEQYCGKHVLVVGGGDSALEAATSLAEEPGTTVTLSYRGDAFSRAKAKNRARVETLAAVGELQVILASTVQSISDNHIEIMKENRTLRIQNDAVIVCVGGILPTGFLKSIGIEVETKHGTA
ncbi:MAG: NAD(P)-binding domain-containing protein [Rhodobacteraceae bacterium]|nr:NAD(P)-binding domain-containing protein [Paracoccaceae bacterium]